MKIELTGNSIKT